MRKGREEENTRSQHRGEGQNDQGLEADGAGEFNCFFNTHSNSPNSGKGLPCAPRYCKDVLELLSVYGRMAPNSGIILPSGR